ncbi:MFS transporter [Blastococcus saxobsidens]|uniref:Putative permeases of the major facilitator superfamily n=1 Tax=Blastococcus saxobsidens (strain DD2) TaxID=1146883 RepID=H6RJ40_BLASD|nr:MFS transporter [Blastococcus saxobsidens]CCG04785.1 Putative permeases of the major facilitator superfamily [Blastococcus saxobsidens DD2]
MADRRGITLVAGGTALIACTYGLARYGYGLFLPTFRADFALSSTLSGLLATGAFGSYCAAALLSRRLVGSGRSRAAAALAGALAAGGCVAVAAAPSAAVLGIAVLVAGSGAGLASPALVALVDRAVPAADRSRAQTVVNAGTGLGVLLAGPLALALTGHWRVAWLCFAVLTVLATMATVRAAAPPGNGARAMPDDVVPSAPWHRLRPAIVAALLAGTGSAAVWTFGRDLVVTAGRLDPLASTAFWIVLGAAGATGAVAGDAVRRWDVPRTWTAFAVTLALATGGLALAPDVPVVAFACAAAFGGSYVALSGVLIAWGTQLHPDSPGSANAILFLTLAAGQAFGALLLGSLTDASSSLTAFIAAAVLATASCLPLTRSRPTPPGKPEYALADHGTPTQ